MLPRKELVTITYPGKDELPEHEGTEWAKGTGLLTIPPYCQMFGSSFRIYSKVVSKSKLDYNISGVIRIPKGHLRISKDIVANKLGNITFDL